VAASHLVFLSEKFSRLKIRGQKHIQKSEAEDGFSILCSDNVT
jgi:hypothetical protein